MPSANNAIKAYWARQSQTAPMPHAEELRLGDLAAKIGLPLEDIQRVLEHEGFDMADANVTLAELAMQKRIAPSEVFAVLQERFHELDQAPRRGQGLGGGRGQGRGQGRAATTDVD